LLNTIIYIEFLLVLKYFYGVVGIDLTVSFWLGVASCRSTIEWASGRIKC